MASWTDLEVTTAPNSKLGADPLKVAFSNDIISSYTKFNRRTPLFQAWCHVLGKLPPINNIGKFERGDPKPTLTTLHNSVACFGGLKRPHDDEEDGRSVLIYVLDVKYSLEYYPDMACLARIVEVPANSVFTVQVRPSNPLQSEVEGVNGMVTRIEPVFNSPEHPTLPAGFDSRYLERFW
ncbi:hypothetical protein [Rhizobium leguminosarum]|uniref:hypothetical protein n=1 Tax=Rhizobium leguminosarum TaxID=384 RepID=UPI00103F4ED6|nr:hypothetical protein [Rhizobium leguminosarum]TCA53734.1 hypothetical protein E0H41_30780 [Rhizobium leguminosarum bv. viciae]TCB17478.1 hypothetical protein E0J09_31295 [Rhizobium leguminosarum bv. viciae]